MPSPVPLSESSSGPSPVLPVVESLNAIERKVLAAVSRSTTAAEAVQRSGLKNIEVLRGFGWLAGKGLVKTDEAEHEMVSLGKNGLAYKKQGLPERRFLKALEKGSVALSDIARRASLQPDEVNICIGMLKSRAAIDVRKDEKDKLVFSLSGQGKSLLRKETLEERFIRKGFPLDTSALADEERFALTELRRRKDIVTVEKRKSVTATITAAGKQALRELDRAGELIERLTPQMIRSGSYQGKRFRHYDLAADVPKISTLAGRRHYVNEAIDYIKRIWLELGFEEMTGPIIQTSFWNFDALFTAQDHPVRDLQDTFFIREPAIGSLPKGGVAANVRATHEDGWTTGSEGWRYAWDPDIARENVLRTHTTCLSARTIAALKIADLPKKYFSVGRCYRNETVDEGHLFEFNQIEGIVVDEKANFRHLLGYLQEFFRKMGYEKIRIRPAYFPYTEPSAEVDGYDPRTGKWFELVGSGLFRPEVVKPLLGKEVPVLAWGMGFERMIRMYYDMRDIRDVYRNDLKQLREVKAWLL